MIIPILVFVGLMLSTLLNLRFIILVERMERELNEVKTDLNVGRFYVDRLIQAYRHDYDTVCMERELARQWLDMMENVWGEGLVTGRAKDVHDEAN